MTIIMKWREYLLVQNIELASLEWFVKLHHNIKPALCKGLVFPF
jgi:hypothetical protein